MYEQPATADLSQGDIIEGCPILVWKLAPPQHFGIAYTRIALPEPYATQP